MDFNKFLVIPRKRKPQKIKNKTKTKTKTQKQRERERAKQRNLYIATFSEKWNCGCWFYRLDTRDKDIIWPTHSLSLSLRFLCRLINGVLVDGVGWHFFGETSLFGWRENEVRKAHEKLESGGEKMKNVIHGKSVGHLFFFFFWCGILKTIGVRLSAFNFGARLGGAKSTTTWFVKNLPPGWYNNRNVYLYFGFDWGHV